VWVKIAWETFLVLVVAGKCCYRMLIALLPLHFLEEMKKFFYPNNLEDYDFFSYIQIL